MDQFIINIDLCVISLGLNGCGTCWEDRNQAGQKTSTNGTQSTNDAGPRVTNSAFVDNCVYIKSERAWQVNLDRKELSKAWFPGSNSFLDLLSLLEASVLI